MVKSKRKSTGSKVSTKRKRAAKTKTKTTKKLVKQQAKKPGAARRATLLKAMAAGGLDLIAAGEIVQAAIPGGPHDIDSTLEDAGLISPPQRATFRTDVVNGVSDRGSTIASGDVPNDADTKLREARKAVHEKSH